ncbi:MAG TPA: rod shape-determining protein MreC [Halanaerobiales bacterium]|nr:rod shape-determining protein MreC [Halanaerobiales bacterium]
MNRFNNTPLILIAIFLLLIISLGISNYFSINIPYLSFVQSGIYNLISPAVSGVNRVITSIDNYIKRFKNAGEILSENEKLKKQLAEERLNNILMKKYEIQNERLRKLLDFKELTSYETQGAKVIGYGPSKWKEKILINKGSKDGLKDGMTVVTYNGSFVGQINYITSDSAQVEMVNNSGFVVAGIVQREDSRAVGLVKGNQENSKYNIMDNLSWDSDIRENDLILTSGLSNTYPKGLPIGKVTEVNPDNYGVSQKAKIDLFIDLNTIEEVLVITDF